MIIVYNGVFSAVCCSQRLVRYAAVFAGRCVRVPVGHNKHLCMPAAVLVLLDADSCVR
jgi:hypothetical protein